MARWGNHYEKPSIKLREAIYRARKLTKRQQKRRQELLEMSDHERSKLVRLATFSIQCKEEAPDGTQ